MLGVMLTSFEHKARALRRFYLATFIHVHCSDGRFVPRAALQTSYIGGCCQQVANFSDHDVVLTPAKQGLRQILFISDCVS